jgi:hypothetical protein
MKTFTKYRSSSNVHDSSVMVFYKQNEKCDTGTSWEKSRQSKHDLGHWPDTNMPIIAANQAS